MNDTDIINIINSYKQFKFNIIYKKLSDEEKNYIINRYKDTSSYKENIIRIYNHIEERPKCPICGNYCKLTNKNIYGKTCGNKKCHKQIIVNNIKETCIKKYGVDSILKIPEINKKFKNTINSHTKEQIENINNKRKQTCLEKYGVDVISKLYNIKQKMYKTNLEKYNNICSVQGINQKIKSKQTCKKLYGTEFATQSNIVKEKQQETKRKNHTFNKSIPEDKSYKLLKDKYSNVIRQYKSELYPFACDFYIPNYNDNKIDTGLYIECNYSWTHCDHPYNRNNNEDQIILEKWKEKNTKYYDNAINTWTIRDVNKRNIAKQNNLNFIEFWNINELKNWINQI